MMRYLGVVIVGALALLAGWAFVRDDVQLERSSTSDGVSEPIGHSAGDADLATASDVAMRANVSPLAVGGTPAEAVVVEGAALERVEPRATTGGIEGRVVFDGGVTAADLGVRVDRIPSFQGDAVLGVVPIALKVDGSFRFDELELGTFEVSVVGRGEMAVEPLAPIVLADVRAGEITRIDDIDVRGALFVHELTVTDERDAPLADALGTYSGRSSGWNNDIEVQDGRARIVTTHRNVDVWLSADGRRCVGVHEVDGPRTVVLAPGLPVNVRLLDPTVLTSDVALTVRLRSGRGAINAVLGEISSSATVELDAEGRAVVLAPAEWTYTVVVSLRLRSGGPSQRIAFEPPLTVEVAEQLGAPFVDVPLTCEQVDAARAAAGG